MDIEPLGKKAFAGRNKLSKRYTEDVERRDCSWKGEMSNFFFDIIMIEFG